MDIKKLGALTETYKVGTLHNVKSNNEVDIKNTVTKNRSDTIEFAQNSPSRSFSATLTQAKQKLAQSLEQDSSMEIIANFKDRISSGEYYVSSKTIVDSMFSL